MPGRGKWLNPGFSEILKWTCCMYQAPGRISALIWSSANTLVVISANEKVSEWQVELQKGSIPRNCR